MSHNQYEITLDKERCMVHLIVHGEIVKDVGEKIITEARAKAAENQYNILCDVRHAEVKATFADWFFLPRNLEVYKTTQGVKTAILIAPGNQEMDYSFFETVTHNLAINIRIFYQEKEALEWLGEFTIGKAKKERLITD